MFLQPVMEVFRDEIDLIFFEGLDGTQVGRVKPDQDIINSRRSGILEILESKSLIVNIAIEGIMPRVETLHLGFSSVMRFFKIDRGIFLRSAPNISF